MVLGKQLPGAAPGSAGPTGCGWQRATACPPHAPRHAWPAGAREQGRAQRPGWHPTAGFPSATKKNSEREPRLVVAHQVGALRGAQHHAVDGAALLAHHAVLGGRAQLLQRRRSRAGGRGGGQQRWAGGWGSGGYAGARHHACANPAAAAARRQRCRLSQNSSSQNTQNRLMEHPPAGRACRSPCPPPTPGATRPPPRCSGCAQSRQTASPLPRPSAPGHTGSQTPPAASGKQG